MLEDLLAPSLKLVICGSAASARSAARQQYYAGPGNKFWKTLFAVGLTDRQLEPAEWRDLLGFGIGLTDVVKGQSGMDREIDFARRDRTLRSKIETYQPAWLAFNSKQAAKVFLNVTSVGYGIRPETIGSTRMFVAPSTSGAASGAWDLRKWQDLAALLRGQASESGIP